MCPSVSVCICPASRISITRVPALINIEHAHLPSTFIPANNNVPKVLLKVLTRQLVCSLRALIKDYLSGVCNGIPATDRLGGRVLNFFVSTSINIVFRETHIVAPPNSRAVGTAHSAAVPGPGAVTGSATHAPQVVDAFLNTSPVC